LVTVLLQVSGQSTVSGTVGSAISSVRDGKAAASIHRAPLHRFAKLPGLYRPLSAKTRAKRKQPIENKGKPWA
jgi:hypothetical protein